MLILKAVSLGPLHGYGIIQRIHQMSGEMLEVEQGSLYPALYRIEQRGWVSSKWDVERDGPPRQVLHAHQGRQEPARGRRGELGSPGPCHRQDAAGHLRGCTMRLLNVFSARLHGLLRREAVIQDIDEEMRLHSRWRRRRTRRGGCRRRKRAGRRSGASAISTASGRGAMRFAEAACSKLSCRTFDTRRGC